MTHAELRSRLPGYAEGTLPEAEADEIRAHLAAGCDECLRRVFMRPVGLPRPGPVRARIAWGALAAVLGAGALGLAAGAVLMARGSGHADPGDEVVRRELVALRAALDGHATRAAETLVGVEERLSAALEVQAARTQAALTRLEERAAERTAPSAPAADGLETSPPPTAAANAQDLAVLRDLLSADGARAVALRASQVAPGATGYAIASPPRALVVVRAEGLPATGPATYRVRVELADGATVWVGDLQQDAGGALTVEVAIPDGQRRPVRAVDLYREPPGSPALSARLP